MPPKKLAAAQVGHPRFAPGDAVAQETFLLSSHMRAREALEFGLAIGEPGFNIFVLGEDNSGRMTATLEFLPTVMAKRPPADDWVYLNNFRHQHRPTPYRLPAGVGRRFRERMATLARQIGESLAGAFGSDEYRDQIRTRGEGMRAEVAQRMQALRAEMQPHGLDLMRSEEGALAVAVASAGGTADLEAMPANQRQALEDRGQHFANELADVNRWAAGRQAEFVQWLGEFESQVGDRAIGRLIDEAAEEYAAYPGLARWLAGMRVDVLENLGRFRPPAADGAPPAARPPEERYAVNLMVDHSRDPHPCVILEANPTYENVFGRIEYRQIEGALETDFTLIRRGSLHRANGGVLVLRAEAVASTPLVWDHLKAALRDREIRVQELYRAGNFPIAGAPRPKPIPLDVKVVIVGNPRWYYTFFSVDPDFQTYFKVKADIDGDMDATPENVACYAGLIRGMARRGGETTLENAALGRLLGVASRWAGDRKKLTARFELIADLVSEARELSPHRQPPAITEAAVVAALANRRRRNARVEDRLHEGISRGTVMIDTRGSVVGQVNALTVRDLGDQTFGTPARVTARASIGRHGVINIEREAALGGPIQQKGVMVLQGFLAGHFARKIPLSFNCSITFEQSYGGVEGDSASIAELLAILSDLGQIPLRQDLAVTGSVNQRGQVQAIGAAHYKVEGFYRTCIEAGGLSGSQGVVLPAANEVNLVLRDDLVEAVASARFHLWSVKTVEEAIELFTGTPAGEPDAHGDYPADTVYGRVAAQLAEFDRILAERGRA